MHPALVFLLVAAGFTLWWGFLLNVIGFASGWWALARRYPAKAHFDGTRFHFCSAKIGWSNYGGALTFVVNAEGIRLSVLFPFRPGHPPLFLPWEDLDVTVTKGWFLDYLDLRYRQAPHVRLRLKKHFGDKLIAAANRSWDRAEPPEGDRPA
ncbi:MAG: hypothetical protein K2V38_08875 [Gemmataceae bacterium]|nr:hypothetical protein [Gemmataceae bacterium]